MNVTKRPILGILVQGDNFNTSTGSLQLNDSNKRVLEKQKYVIHSPLRDVEEIIFSEDTTTTEESLPEKRQKSANVDLGKNGNIGAVIEDNEKSAEITLTAGQSVSGTLDSVPNLPTSTNQGGDGRKENLGSDENDQNNSISQSTIMDSQQNLQQSLKFVPISYTDVIPDENDLNYGCRVCKVKLKSKKWYYSHLSKRHNMILKPFECWRLGDTEPIPNENDPNNFCSVCCKTYTSLTLYRQHLRSTHNMQLARLKKANLTTASGTKVFNGMIRFSCNKCTSVLKTWKSLKRHLYNSHGVTLQEKEPTVSYYSSKEGNNGRTMIHLDPTYNVQNIVSVPPNDNDGSLLSEAQEYTTARAQQEYTNNTAQEDITTAAQATNKIAGVNTDNNSEQLANTAWNTIQSNAVLLPDDNHSQSYCSVCKRKYKTYSRYRSHLADTHQIRVIRNKGNFDSSNSDTSPNQEDSNNYCATCDKTLSSKQAYQKHIRNTHKIMIIPAAMKKNPPIAAGAAAAENSPDDCCTLCDKKFTAGQSFQHHTSIKHGKSNLIYPSTSDSKVDITNPDFYCGACEKKFISWLGFYNHIRHRHKTIALPVTRFQKSSSTNRDLTATAFCDTAATSADPGIIIKDLDLCCNTCDISFESNSGLSKHLIASHRFIKNNTRMLYCPPCDKLFSVWSVYWDHNIKVHNQGSKKPELSNSGGAHQQQKTIVEDEHIKENVEPGKLSRRRVQMTGTKQIMKHREKCVRTGHGDEVDEDDAADTAKKEKVIPVKQRFYRMDPNVLPDIDDPNFYCKSCQVTFNAQAAYRLHVSIIHKMALPTNDDDNLYCKLCRRSYRCKKQFDDHTAHLHALPAPKRRSRSASVKLKAPSSLPAKRIRNYNNSNPTKEYICDICQDTFTNKQTLRQHREEYHYLAAVFDEKREYCNLCQFTYSSKLSYQHHWETLHDNTDDNQKEKRKTINNSIRRVGRSKTAVSANSRGNGSKSVSENISNSSNATNVKRKLGRPPKKLGNLAMVKEGRNISDTGDAFRCQHCNLTYGSAVHYRLHCFKQHNLDL